MINKFKDFLSGIRAKLSGFKFPQIKRNSVGENLPEMPGQPPQWKAKLLRLGEFLSAKWLLVLPFLRKLPPIAKKLFQRSGLASRVQQVNWASLPDRLLSKEMLTTHHRAFLAAFLMVGMYSFGKITAIILRGRPFFEAPRFTLNYNPNDEFDPMTLGQVKSADPFKTLGGGNRPVIADTRCDAADTRSSLPIKLVNTIVLQDSVKSIAAVQVRSARELKEFREGDNLDGLAKIFHINRLELIVKNLETGACESIASDKGRDAGSPIAIMSPQQGAAFKAQQKIKGIDNVGNKYTISKDLLNDKLKDISQVLTQARAIKMTNPDGSLAFKITEIEPGGIFAYLGIQNDDVITSIDGRPISDLNEVMSLFGRLKGIDKLKLGIRREGEESELDYNMKQ